LVRSIAHFFEDSEEQEGGIAHLLEDNEEQYGGIEHLLEDNEEQYGALRIYWKIMRVNTGHCT
jgi:hypothetical protein